MTIVQLLHSQLEFKTCFFVIQEVIERPSSVAVDNLIALEFV